MADRRETALAAVVGFPVSHSLSPEIFSFLAGQTGRDLHYRKLEIPPKSLRRTLRAIQDARLFAGWNVTIPHKQSAARLVTRLAPGARELGAINVIRFERGGTVGYNTDVQGIEETLRRFRFDPRGKRAVIYGAGGAALAAGWVLGRLGADRVTFVSRSPAPARRACRRLCARFPRASFARTGWDRAPAGADLYVNATPLGMSAFPGSPPLPEEVAPGALAFDLVYRPLRTRFLREAEARGMRIAGGLDMLVAQALATWELWFGPLRPALRSRLRGQLYARLERRLGAKTGGKR